MPLTSEEHSSVERAGAGGVLDPMCPHGYLVESASRETHDTFTLTLQPSEDAELPRFAPGQFSMLYVFGVGELPISISGDPEQSRRLAYTVRSVGPATQALVSRRPGEISSVIAPWEQAAVDIHGHSDCGVYRVALALPSPATSRPQSTFLLQSCRVTTTLAYPVRL